MVRNASSPYARGSKTPYKYSDLYEAWRRSAMNGQSEQARRLSVEHTVKWLGFDPTTHKQLLDGSIVRLRRRGDEDG